MPNRIRARALALAALSLGSAARAALAAPVAVSFRLAPMDAVLYAEGRELELRPARNGIRVAALEAGDRELLLLADGCVARRLRLFVPAGGLALVEEKLERCGSSLELEAMGRTGLRPKSVSYTPDGAYLVLPLLSGPGADVLDARSLALAGRLEPPPAMGRIEGFVESAFIPGLREIWVSQMHNSLVHVFDLDSFSYKESFPSGGLYPKVIAISPDGERAYISNWVSEDVAIFDARTRKLLGRVPTGGTPRGLAPSPDGAFLYVARFSDGALLRVRLEDCRVEVFHAADGGAKRHLVFDSARRRLYATDMERDSLFVLDAPSGRVIAEIALGPNPNGCALSPDGRRIYASTRGPNGEYGYEKKGPLAGELIAIDAERLVVVDRQWGGNQPTGLAVSPDGSRVVFTDFLDHRVESYLVRAASLETGFQDIVPTR